MPDTELIPAILAKDLREAQDKLSQLGSLLPYIQLDVMDGYFVPNISWHDAQEFITVETSILIELHLMVRDPETIIRAWAHERRCRRAIWHIEIPVDHQRLIQLCRSLGWECGLALSPRTAIPAIAPYLSSIDEVLVMGVEPGFSAQGLLPSTIDRLKHISRLAPRTLIGIDGGVTVQNATSLIEAGADRLYSASSIFKSDNPIQAILEFRNHMKAVERA